jgi:hypothetical protein
MNGQQDWFINSDVGIRKFWRIDAEKLNAINNIKVIMETGIVLMQKSGDWHILCARCYRLGLFNYEIIVDYDNMSIGVVNDSKYIDWIFNHNTSTNKLTMSGLTVKSIDTSYCLGVIDEKSGITIDFPQVTYEVDDNKYFDADFNMIAEGEYIKCKPEIESFQHVHIIKLLGNYLLVFKSYKAVEIVGNKIKDGDDEYYLYYGADAFLLNANTKIELEYINNYEVEEDIQLVEYFSDSALSSVVKYNGLTIPNEERYKSICNVDDVWLGIIDFTVYALEPYNPKSGKKTNAATIGEL